MRRKEEMLKRLILILPTIRFLVQTFLFSGRFHFIAFVSTDRSGGRAIDFQTRTNTRIEKAGMGRVQSTSCNLEKKKVHNLFFHDPNTSDTLLFPVSSETESKPSRCSSFISASTNMRSHRKRGRFLFKICLLH
jgi:hypothetical protein